MNYGDVMSNVFFKDFPFADQIFNDLLDARQNSALKLLRFLCREMDMDAGAVCVSRKVLETRLSIKRQALGAAIKRLIEVGAIKVPYRDIYAVNPMIAWCGKSTKGALFNGSETRGVNKKLKHVIDPKAEKSVEVKVRLAVEDGENA